MHTKEVGEALKDVVQRDIDDDIFHISNDPNIKIHEGTYTLINKNTTRTSYHDLTGRFPKKSTQRNEYVMIGYHYDASFIIGIQVKNRTTTVFSAAW